MKKRGGMVRRYRVAAGCYEPEAGLSIDQRRASLHAHLDALLAEQKPDLAVLPETALVHGSGIPPERAAEPLDGPTIRDASALARSHGANVCLPILEAADGRIYNSAVYLDRRGRVAGVYRKHTPMAGELEQGIRPGADDPDPVLLDGLRIGTAICFDENFPDLLWRIFRRGVDLLVFPAYTYGGRLMQYWALACGVPLVAAFPWESAIYDRDGTVLAEGGTRTSTFVFGHHPPWLAAELNMQSRLYHLDFNQDKIKAIGRRYGRNVDVKLLVREARFQLTVLSEDLDIAEVEEALALIPLQRYLAEGRRAADRCRD